MNAGHIYEWVQDDSRAVRRAAVPLLLAMMIGVYFLVRYTGGVKYVFSHSMYIPVILAGLVFGIRGGIIAGALGGLILGPLMPVDVITGEPQDIANWLFRASFFVIIGVLVGGASDSTQKYLNHIKWIMSHDVPSGLLNRLALIDVMKSNARSQMVKKDSGLALVSIENFAEVDSTYGPKVIDGMINELATRFNKVYHNIILYRINTHQLGVLLPINDHDTNVAVLDKFIEVSKYPFTVGDIPIHGDVRIGFVDLSTIHKGHETYLRKAEIALSSATEHSQSWMVFTPQLESETVKNNLRLLSELQKALEGDELLMYYQPKVDIASGKTQGVEALLRWQHPQLGLIEPGDFIPRAETSVLIGAITHYAIDTALAQHVTWREQGMELPVSVNLSPRNLLQPDFVDTVFHLLNYHRVKGNFLEFEVTENTLMADIENSIAKLVELSKADITISIDDFGVGYSSLQYLNSLPVTTVKIDGSFIRTLFTDNSSKQIVKAAVNLAHGLEINVVAEGVEDKAAYDYLAYLGCDIAQGFYVSQALPGADMLNWRKEGEQRVHA